MDSRWVDAEANAVVERYAASGIGRDVALRVHTTRLLGSDPRLVLHGGGNTSVKTTIPDLLGDSADVLCVKGSGWDMGSIEPAGLPAVRLAPLQRLRTYDALPDEEMVRILRANLIDPGAPTPSVETLLHAFIPQKYIDHTHSTAVLSLVDQPNGAELCAEVYGDTMAVVPYLLPGFGLAKLAAQVHAAAPTVVGLILLKHGIFTFGADAREAYERMIEKVTLAERRLARGRSVVFAPGRLPTHVAPVANVAPIVRGICSQPDAKVEGAFRRPILEFRSDENILRFVNGAELARYSQAGVVTPDHTIRTKNWPLIVAAPEHGGTDTFRKSARAAAAAFVARYEEYFARNNQRCGSSKKMLDPFPRVVLVPGVGLFGLGRSKKDARVAADLATAAVTTITGAEAIGQYEPIGEADMFDCEYWSLEQAKLGTAPERPLAGQVAVITGAGGAIGSACARSFAAAGAEVALLDVDGVSATRCAREIGGAAMAVECDVTDEASVHAAFDRTVEAFGGVDILVSNAGAAYQGRIGEVEESVLRKSFELNFFSHQRLAQHAVRIMQAQGTGGCLLFNVSKQAVNPGANFGPYGLPKAATLFLVRQYALDHGVDGIRANAVNADRIRSGLLTDEMIALRAGARGSSVEEYMTGNLLGREVTADDVAQAFLHHALALKTTGDVTTVDGGNIAAALR